MKRKLLSMTGVFILILGLLFFASFTLWQSETKNSQNGMQIVVLNEIQHLVEQVMEREDDSELPKIRQQVIQQKEAAIRYHQAEEGSGNNLFIILAFSGCFLFIFCMFGYVYYAILKPFDKMKCFANEIAAGNFDVRLNYERANYFGAFTWAFDSMRREVTKARALEKEAVENNKVVIATLSHDIKTPIASIRAYTEALQANLDNAESRELYLQVIIRKCDEVAKLTNDLFLHSLSDLEKLQMEPERTDLVAITASAIKELAAEKEDIIFSADIQSVYCCIDRKRYAQILENLINNARKYASPPIEVILQKTENGVRVSVRDHGNGIADEDIPFIFEKFYRGKNSENKQGSGLGLYIVKYIMQQSKGDITLHNHTDGLEVILDFQQCA